VADYFYCKLSQLAQLSTENTGTEEYLNMAMQASRLLMILIQNSCSFNDI
jgi:hypothetical protein